MLKSNPSVCIIMASYRVIVSPGEDRSLLSYQVKSCVWEGSSSTNYNNSWNGGTQRNSSLSLSLNYLIHSLDHPVGLHMELLVSWVHNSMKFTFCCCLNFLQHILWPFLLKMIIPRSFTAATATVGSLTMQIYISLLCMEII